MSAISSIEWTDRTWNPVRGCSRVSPGCDHCYAMHFAHRFSGDGGVYEGLTVLRPKDVKRPGVDWAGRARFVPEMLVEPLKWRKPQRVFVNSMSDLFHESLTNEEIATVFAVMAAAPLHTFQVLTKRPRRALEWFAWVQNQQGDEATLHARVTCYLSAARKERSAALADFQHQLRPPWPEGGKWPLPNVWLGVSAENQATADERIPLLLKLPAAVRFVSAEPLLGPLDLRKFLNVGGVCECDPLEPPGSRCEGKGRNGWIRCNAGARRINWLIVGGESGNGARPCDIEWLESLVLQCREQLGMGIKPWPVPCFVKQLGAVPFDSRESDRCTDEPHPGGAAADPSCRINLNDRKGGDMSEWPESLRVRQFPEARA